LEFFSNNTKSGVKNRALRGSKGRTKLLSTDNLLC